MNSENLSVWHVQLKRLSDKHKKPDGSFHVINGSELLTAPNMEAAIARVKEKYPESELLTISHRGMLTM